MKNNLIKMIAALACFVCITASAENIPDRTTMLFGYEHGSIEGFGSLHGPNFKIIYEPESLFGIVGSLTALRNIWDNTDEFHFEKNINGKRIRVKTEKKATQDTEYYSAMFGPSLRVNDLLTVYGIFGFYHLKMDNPLIHDPVTKKAARNGSHSYNNVAYGAGVILNVTDTLTLAAGYEGAPAEKNQDYRSLNAASLSMGYHF